MRKVSAERLAETRAARKKMLADPLHPVTRMRRERLEKNAREAQLRALRQGVSFELLTIPLTAKAQALSGTIAATRGGLN